MDKAFSVAEKGEKEKTVAREVEVFNFEGGKKSNISALKAENKWTPMKKLQFQKRKVSFQTFLNFSSFLCADRREDCNFCLDFWKLSTSPGNTTGCHVAA